MAANSLVKINTGLFKEWMTAITYVTKAGTLLEEIDGCNYSGKTSRLSLKKSGA